MSEAESIQNVLPIQGWADFGLAGLVIAALFAFLIFMLRSHTTERKEWKDDFKDMHEQSNSTLTTFTHSVTELTGSIKEMILRNDIRDKPSR
jgi:hypothetical protein